MDSIITIIRLILIPLFPQISHTCHRLRPLMPLEVFSHICTRRQKNGREKKFTVNFLLSRAFANQRVSNPHGEESHFCRSPSSRTPTHTCMRAQHTLHTRHTARRLEVQRSRFLTLDEMATASINHQLNQEQEKMMLLTTLSQHLFTSHWFGKSHHSAVSVTWSTALLWQGRVAAQMVGFLALFLYALMEWVITLRWWTKHKKKLYFL